MLATNKSGGFSLPAWIEFVELKTKVASVFPMTIGVLWASYRYGAFDGLNTFLFVGAVLSFDMCTTAINNTMDYYKAHDAVYQKESNVVGKYGLEKGQMLAVILGLLGFSILLSLLLVWRTDGILLPMGMICFLIGIFYTFGPLPLSRLPLGELFSGLTMGFGIFFLAVFVQEPSLLVTSQVTGAVLQLQLQWVTLLEVGLMSLPLVCLIANIMLANNTCDLEEDIRNQRKTLVYYIGKANALFLYQVLAIFPWLLWLAYLTLGFLPLWAGLFFPIFLLSYRSLRRFLNKQVKRETFVESVKSFVLYGAMYVLVLGLALLG